MSQPLPFTGERFVPGHPNAQGEMWYEHWHRYHFVLPWVSGASVLDVACGEGYGSALLAGGALRVTGLDVSAEAVAHARSAYRDRANLEFAEGSCTRMPFADGQFDIAVSFETLEHIGEQEAFADELKRVLKPDGLLVISTPNKAEYSDKRGFANEFHVKELYREQFDGLLASRFATRRWLSQRNAFVSIICEGEDGLRGDCRTVSQAAPDAPAAALPPLYWIVLASNAPADRWPLPARLSVFTDAEEWAYNDYRETYKGFQHYRRREQELEAQVAALRAPAAASPAAAAPDAADSWLARLIKKLST
ncbi:MAG TPA: class I SAM-dependent methyltransferase [Burkholderiaceae bacterium]|nr:class I SAM-dependent methyltransferase [Burkholderiaceae bacterium]